MEKPPGLSDLWLKPYRESRTDKVKKGPSQPPPDLTTRAGIPAFRLHDYSAKFAVPGAFVLHGFPLDRMKVEVLGQKIDGKTTKLPPFLSDQKVDVSDLTYPPAKETA